MKKINIQELLKTSKKINIQELLNNITQNKNTLILAVLIILIVLYLDIALILGVQRRALGAINPKIAQLKVKLKELNLDSLRMQTQMAGIKREQIKEMASPGQMAFIIEEISRMANQHEVEIFQIKPNLKSQAATAVSKHPPQRDNYSPALIDLEVVAGYHQLGKFLAELENYSVFLEVEELDIARSEKDPFKHSVRLELKTYVAK
jgi:Tfp pilus assembly protein PilO